MKIISIIAGILNILYGALNTFAGFGQLKARKIQAWAAWLMIGAGLLILAIGVMIFRGFPAALFLLPIGLIAIHLLTISNGFHLYGKINPRHHILRLIISLVLFGLAFWSLK